MFCVFNRLNSNNTLQDIMLCKNYIAYLSRQAGFIEGSLYNKLETNFSSGEGRQFVIILIWETKETYQVAKRKYRLNSSFAKKWEDQSNFDVIIGEPHTLISSKKSISTKTLILITLSSVSSEQEHGFIAKWQQAKDYMKDQDGFLGTSFYKLINSDKFKFMNVAEWESEIKFLEAITQDAFKEIIHDGYEDSCYTSGYNKIFVTD